MPTIVGNHEVVARYIFSKRHFNQHPARIKAEAYLPVRGEVSVFRIAHLTDHTIWKIGTDIAAERHRTLYARGDTSVGEIRRVGVEVQALEPPPRHANIIGWPEKDKARQKLIALRMANLATVVLK